MEKVIDKVAVLMPIAESVPALTFQGVVALVGYASKQGVLVGHIGVTERTLVDTARNVLASEFLKTDNDWALWLDSDMVFPKETLTRLLETAKKKKAKMVTGVYFQRGGKHFPVCWIRDPKLESKEKVQVDSRLNFDQNEYIGTYALPGKECKEPFKADTAGFGCALIHREVFELIDYPYFKFLPDKCSEDFYFFVKAKQKGFKLWADPSLDLKHIGTPELINKDDCYKYLEENDIGIKAIKEDV